MGIGLDFHFLGPLLLGQSLPICFSLTSRLRSHLQNTSTSKSSRGVCSASARSSVDPSRPSTPHQRRLRHSTPPVIDREGLPSLMTLSAHPPRKVRSSALPLPRDTEGPDPRGRPTLTT